MTTKCEAGGREGCGEEDKECVEHPQAGDGVHRDWQGLRKGNWLGNQENIGCFGRWTEACPLFGEFRTELVTRSQGFCLPLYGETKRHLLSVPSTGGRELLGLRDFISGALVFSLVRASGTREGT